MGDSLATILLVEDEECLRDCIYQMLVLNGHNVYQASGNTALRVLEECSTPVEVLITDVLMPGINGINLALEVLAKHPTIPVIFMSGYGPDIMDRFPNAPRATFLAKPFELSELIRAVRTSVTSR